MQTFQNYLIYWCSRKQRFFLFYISLFTRNILENNRVQNAEKLSFQLFTCACASFLLLQLFKNLCNMWSIWIHRFSKTANIDFYWKPQWLEWSESIKMDSWSCSFTQSVAELDNFTHGTPLYLLMSPSVLQVSVFGHEGPEVSVDSVMAAGGEFPDFEHKRMETISRLWNITETLNVLYRENWTVMANVEIIKFQNEMIQSIREEMRETEGRSHHSCSKVNTRDFIIFLVITHF